MIAVLIVLAGVLLGVQMGVVVGSWLAGVGTGIVIAASIATAAVWGGAVGLRKRERSRG